MDGGVSIIGALNNGPIDSIRAGNVTQEPAFIWNVNSMLENLCESTNVKLNSFVGFMYFAPMIHLAWDDFYIA